MPLYFHGPGYDVSPLLFWSFRDGAHHSLLIPPLLMYRSATADSQTITMLPFFRYSSTPDSKLFLSLLAVYSEELDYERTVIGGLY